MVERADAVDPQVVPTGAAMLIPVEVEQPEDFIARATAALADNGTHLYVDTSLMMWLTAVGPSSRAAFLDWSSTMGDRIHVPAWAAQEYFRHHQRKTQANEIAEKCSAVEKALSNLKSHMRVYADGPLIPDKPEMTFVKDLETAAERVAAAMQLALRWDYDSAAVEVIAWMNERALATTGVLDSFAELKRRGSARYGHEVPPGFEDDHKDVNRFGDLIFWEDVIADALSRNAATVAVLTRDRKKDWFFSGLEGEPGEDLRRLRGTWNAVPVPHPMLTLEMRAKANAELLLIDELYLGAVMWQTDKHRFGRLAAVTFGMNLERLEAATAPPPGIVERADKRDAADVTGYGEASRIVAAAKDSADRGSVLVVLGSLEAGAPEVETAIEAFTSDRINAMDYEELAALARHLYDHAQVGPSAPATLARRLLDSIDKIDALHASAIVGGMLVAAYVENGVARNTASGQLLQELFEWRVDTGVARTVNAVARELRRMRSPALYLPSTSIDPIDVRIDASQSNRTTPVAVGQIYVGPQAVLVDPSIESDQLLSTILGGRDETTVDALIAAVSSHYGVPLGIMRVVDAEGTEARTVLATTGFDRFDPLRQPIRALNSEVGEPTVPPEPGPALVAVPVDGLGGDPPGAVPAASEVLEPDDEDHDNDGYEAGMDEEDQQ